jgi:hypothetical protein
MFRQHEQCLSSCVINDEETAGRCKPDHTVVRQSPALAQMIPGRLPGASSQRKTELARQGLRNTCLVIQSGSLRSTTLYYSSPNGFHKECIARDGTLSRTVSICVCDHCHPALTSGRTVQLPKHSLKNHLYRGFC